MHLIHRDQESEITVPSFIVDDQPDTYQVDYAKTKTKMVLVLMSHCVGYRISFIKQLNKYVQVDNFGAWIGNNAKSCPRFNKECHKKMRQYKFYLALENSFYEDKKVAFLRRKKITYS